MELTLGAVETGAYAAADGRCLRYRVVRAREERHSLLYLHGIESHGGWFLPAARLLAGHGCTTWLLDRRGSGRNRGEDAGDAPSARVLLEDVSRFRAHAHLDEVVLVGLSWGGKLALASALDQPAGVRALVLVTPGLVPLVDLSWPRKLLVLLDLAVGGRSRFHVPIEPEMFTRTPDLLTCIREDPLRLERVTSRFLLAGRVLDRRIRAGLHALDVPVLLLLAGQDRIVDNPRTLALLEGRQLRALTYEHATHSIQLDDTDAMVHDLTTFLDDVAC